MPATNSSTPKDAETVATIKELLETRVRPAVANDGGDITFRGYKDGIVYLHMRGACSGCPSSTATLQHGIQNLLRHFVPDVREVQADLAVTDLIRRCPACAGHRVFGAAAARRGIVADTGMSMQTYSCAFSPSIPRSSACSAAVLDTERARSLRSESLPMERGHAEALMPLIARVMDRGSNSNSRSLTASP